MKKTLLYFIFIASTNLFAQVSITWHNVPSIVAYTGQQEGGYLPLNEGDYLEFTLHNLPTNINNAVNFRFTTLENGGGSKYMQIYLNDVVEFNKPVNYKNDTRKSEIISTIDNGNSKFDRRIRLTEIYLEGLGGVQFSDNIGNDIYPHLRIVGGAAKAITTTIDLYANSGNTDNSGNTVTTITNTLNTNEYSKTSLISVHPNPANDIIYIDNNNESTIVSIYKITGQLVIEETIINSIDIAKLDAGIYILKIKNQTIKFIKS